MFAVLLAAELEDLVVEEAVCNILVLSLSSLIFFCLTSFLSFVCCQSGPWSPQSSLCIF